MPNKLEISCGLEIFMINNNLHHVVHDQRYHGQEREAVVNCSIQRVQRVRQRQSPKGSTFFSVHFDLETSSLRFLIRDLNLLNNDIELSSSRPHTWRCY